MTNHEYGIRRARLQKQVNKWLNAMRNGGTIKGRKRRKLCQFHLNRCLTALMDFEAEHVRYFERADGRTVCQMPEGNQVLMPEDKDE